MQEDGDTRRVAVAHVDPDTAELAYELEQHFPRDPDAAHGMPYVLRTGRSQLYPVITDALLEEMAPTPEHRALVRQLGFQSCLVVPLKVREQVIGALTLAIAESGRRFGEADLALVEELARRAAMAVDNARLYREATALNKELEQRVTRRTEELLGANARLETEINKHQQAEMRFRSLLESAPDGMVIVNQDGQIVLVNSQMEALFGYTRQELLGRPVEILIPDSRRQQHERHRHGYHHEPRLRPMGRDLEFYGLRRDGSQFPVEISLSPLTADEGLLVIAAVRDITERKEAEETTWSLLRLSEKLNRRRARYPGVCCQIWHQVGAQYAHSKQRRRGARLL
ncbi:MAG TPA: PAS domain S-box protein [Anaerolineae bacterium]